MIITTEILAVIVAVISLLVVPFVYIFSSAIRRVETVEASLRKKVDREELMILLNTRLEPLREDMIEIKTLLETLIEIRIKQHVVTKPKAVRKTRTRK